MGDEEGIIVPCGYNEKSITNHTVMILEQLNVQRYYGAFCDVTVQVEEYEFRLHKCILAAASSQLQTMMYSLRDSNSNVLMLRDVTLVGFRCIVEFIYTGLLKLDALCVEHALNAAQFLDLRSVEKSCLDFMKSLSVVSASSVPGTGQDAKITMHPYRSGMIMPVSNEKDPVVMVGSHSPPGPAHIPPPLFMLPSAPQPADNPLHSDHGVNTHGPQTSATPTPASSTPQPISQPPPSLPPHPLPPFSLQTGSLPIAPSGIPYPNTAPTMTMDTNYIEDYLKMIESMQGDQSQQVPPPSISHPNQSMTSIGPPIGNIHNSDHTLHPPPPLYLQQGIGFGGPPPTPSSYVTLKEVHLGKQVMPLPICSVTMTSLQSSTSTQSTVQLPPLSMSGPSSSVTRPHTYSSNTNHMSQYSAEDVRRTILNVLSQEKFDDEEESSSKSDQNTKEHMSLTTLLNLAPIHRSDSPKASMIDQAHFEDISEIEDISNAGDDVDVEVDDDSSVHDTNTQPCPVSESNVPRDASPFRLQPSPSEDFSCNTATPCPDEEIQVDDCDPLPCPAATLVCHESEDLPGPQPPLPTVVDSISPTRDLNNTSEQPEYYQLQNITPPTTPGEPTESSATPPSIQKGKKKTQSKLPEDTTPSSACEADKQEVTMSGNDAAAQFTTVNAAAPVNFTNNNGLVQIIITNPPVNPTMIANPNIHRDPSLFSKPLKKRIKMQVKKKLCCEECGREFNKQESLQRHKLSHNAPTQKCCHVCGQKFSRNSELTRHMRTHTAELYSCWFCSSQFYDPSLFKQHMNTVHGEKKPFYCVFPGCSFRSHKLSNVERHASIHSSQKTFLCFQCGKSFAQANGLRSHLRSCLQQRGYLCDLCGAKFNYLQSMKSHRLLHTGEKPYTCSDCGATFTDARNLRRHKRIHDNVFPYSCPHCQKTFRHSNTLKTHVASHEASQAVDKSELNRTDNNTLSNNPAGSEMSTSSKDKHPKSKQCNIGKSKKRSGSGKRSDKGSEIEVQTDHQ